MRIPFQPTRMAGSWMYRTGIRKETILYYWIDIFTAILERDRNTANNLFISHKELSHIEETRWWNPPEWHKESMGMKISGA